MSLDCPATGDHPRPDPGEDPEVRAFRAASTERALWRLSQRGHSAATVVDVGASNGSWSAVAERLFPKAQYLLIEAQECHREALEDYCRSRPNARSVLAAAGARAGGVVYFDDSTPFGGVASEIWSSQTRTEVPTTSIDAEVDRLGLPGPYLVKLDTHGFEIPILEGAARTLANASILVIEVYNFRLTGSSLRFWEMCAWLEARGFLPADIAEPLWRARDRAFWQIDMLFVPASSGEFAHPHYE